MLTRKHLLNVIMLGAPLLVGMVSEFFMYMITYSALLIGGFFSKKWLEVNLERDRIRAET
jgi:hypothetical protein